MHVVGFCFVFAEKFTPTRSSTGHTSKEKVEESEDYVTYAEIGKFTSLSI